MNFTDTTLLRLATPALRAALFDADALEQIAGAAYDTDALPLDAPFSAVFDELHLAAALPDNGVVEGAWTPVGTALRVDARFQITGLGIGASPVLRVEALWRGSIVARTVPTTGRIAEVTVAVPDLGSIDAEIIRDLGALPAAPVALEAARRERLLARLRLGADQPSAITDTAVTAFLAQAGVATAAELLGKSRAAPIPAMIRLRYEPLAASPPAPIPLPITAVVLIRDAASFSLATLLKETALVRERVGQMGLGAMPKPNTPIAQQIRPRRPVIVVWILEPSIFDDADWPGGAVNGTAAEKRAAHRRDAGVWLAREGIGLAVP